MKTITIPSDSTRYVVSVNGRVYVYKGGETVSVPDEVAEVIERQSEALPLPEAVKPSADDVLDDATIADAGKALGIDESGKPALIEVATTSVADGILADATASDKGKALGIDASGEPALIEVGPTVVNVTLAYNDGYNTWVVYQYDKNATPVVDGAQTNPNVVVMVDFGDSAKYPFYMYERNSTELYFISPYYWNADLYPPVVIKASKNGSVGNWITLPLDTGVVHGEINYEGGTYQVENVDQEATSILIDAQGGKWDMAFVDVGSSSEIYRLTMVTATAAYFENVSGAQVVATEEGWSYQEA